MVYILNALHYNEAEKLSELLYPAKSLYHCMYRKQEMYN